MNRSTRQAWRTGLLIAGSVAAILPIGLFILVSSTREKDIQLYVSWGILLYYGIAAVCFIAVWQLKPPSAETRGFEVAQAAVDKTSREQHP